MVTKKLDPNAPRSAQELGLLFEISQLLDQSLDLKLIMSPVLDSLAKHLGLGHATITLLHKESSEIQTEFAHGLSPKQINMGHYKVGEGVTGKVVQSGKPAIIKKTSESPIYINRTKRLGKKELSFICVPIKIGKEVVGALSADREFIPEADLDDDMRLLSIIASLIARAVKLRQAAEEQKALLEQENQRLRNELKNRFRPSNIIGNASEMQVVYEQISQAAKNPVTVLIQGETGTGKELVAKAIHYNSDRANKPFVAVHCAALAENVIESELFGHIKGAFTGAISDRKGRFELANGGTLFLDEIGEIPLNIQTKLLRVLQELEFERVGSTQTIKVNVRLIAATNRDLEAMVNAGQFREDLYYRLNVFQIFVPPLRKRKADIGLLSDYFLAKYSEQYSKNVKRLSSSVIDMLYAYHWPGNVRELENVLERALVLAEGEVIHAHHMPPTLQTAETSGTMSSGNLKNMVDSYEKDIIVDTLKSTRGNVAAAARLLQTTQRILGYKIIQFNINPKQYTS